MNEKIKTLLTILFVCIVSSLLSGCGSVGGTICWQKEYQIRNGLVYLPNQEEPFTGKNLCKYENGQIESEKNYKDGKLDGKLTTWYSDGLKSLEGNYKDGKEDGKWTDWYENGQIESEGNVQRREDGKLQSR